MQCRRRVCLWDERPAMSVAARVDAKLEKWLFVLLAFSLSGAMWWAIYEAVATLVRFVR